MNIEVLILSFENYFYYLFGIEPHGPLGLLIGLLIFIFLVFILRYEKKNKNLDNNEIDEISEVGDPIEASLNLSRSYIEMGQEEKAKIYINKVLENPKTNEKQKLKAESFLKNINSYKNG